ncbi:MAG: restriction endonuclease, partial [Actinomycetota bacterium]|nr:restriction endonuclease [Actinomycetota bacterium]
VESRRTCWHSWLVPPSGQEADLRDAIDALHDELFEDRPKNPGTRLERIIALVFAALEDGEVSLLRRLRGPGRRAQHRIDVDVAWPNGKLIIIECKNWDDRVDQDVINSVASRRTQLEAARAVVVSVHGFTAGAVDVAHDEAVELLTIRRIRPDDPWPGILKEIRATGTFIAPDLIELLWRASNPREVQSAASDERNAWGIDGDPFDSFVETVDGAPAETVRELLAQSPTPTASGRHEHEVPLPGPRFLRLADGTRIAVRALSWIESVTVFTHEFTIGPSSPGVLFVHRVTVDGTKPTRVLLDDETRAWRLDDDSRLVPRT